MKKQIRSIGISVFAAILLLAGIVPVQAHALQSAEKENPMGFYVRALLPENQRDTSLTHFDLQMQPEQQQQLDVEIVNTSSAPIWVSVEAVSASTAPNGVIDYYTPDVKDETLKIPFWYS